MTTNEVREYLKSYRNYKDRVAYIDNKVLNVHSIQYNNVKGRTSEPKTQNNYILMKEKCKKEMGSWNNFSFIIGTCIFFIFNIMAKFSCIFK